MLSIVRVPYSLYTIGLLLFRLFVVRSDSESMIKLIKIKLRRLSQQPWFGKFESE